MIRQLLISALAMTSLAGSAMTAKMGDLELSHKQNKIASSFLSLPREATARKNVAKVMRKSAPQEPITELPADATVEEYSLFSMGYGIGEWGALTDMTDQGFAGQIAFCGNGDVYIKNPTSTVITDTYIKGHIDGDKITFQFPQTISKEYDETTETWVYIQACAMDAVYEEPYEEGEQESFGFPIDYEESDVQTLEMEVLEDGMIQLHLPENKALGYKYVWDETLADYGLPVWAEVSDYCLEWKPFDSSLLELPAGATTEKWNFVHEGTGTLLNVAFVDNEIYIQGLYSELPEAWVKGTVGDGKITFASEQYLGLQESNNHYVYLIGAHSETVWDPEFGEEMTVVVATETFDFKYDAEAKVIDFDGNFIVFNGGVGTFYFIGYAMFGTISYQGDATPAAPADPEIFEFITDFSADGMYGLTLKLSPLDVNGNIFNVNDLYYNIFVNGSDEPLVFKADNYSSLESDMTNIPFGFSDDFDFVVYEEYRIITIYTFDDITKIGLQLVRDDNGNLLKSNVVEFVPTSINGTVSEKEIESVEYFDINGRRVMNPDKGIYIKVARYADGTTRTVKAIR